MKRTLSLLGAAALLTLALSACLCGYHRGPGGHRHGDCDLRGPCDKTPCDVKADCRKRCDEAPCVVPPAKGGEPEAKK